MAKIFDLYNHPVSLAIAATDMIACGKSITRIDDLKY